MQGGTCGTENCDGCGLMYSAWPIRVVWVAGSWWMPIWLTNADQLRSAHAGPSSQSNQPQSARVTCGSSVKSVFWIWSLRPGCSKVSWDLWNRTITGNVILCYSPFFLLKPLHPCWNIFAICETDKAPINPTGFPAHFAPMIIHCCICTGIYISYWYDHDVYC